MGTLYSLLHFSHVLCSDKPAFIDWYGAFIKRHINFYWGLGLPSFFVCNAIRFRYFFVF